MTGSIIKLSTAEGYDRWSEIYDTNKNPLTALDEQVFQKNFGLVKKGDKIADLGCGTGRVTKILEEQGAKVTGVDGSKGMLDIAQKKCNPETDFIVHDFANPLPFEKDSFDKVVSCLVLEHIPDLHLFFTETNRICKKGGIAYITAMHPAMMLMGNEANFTDPKTGEEVRPKGYQHQLSDFVNNINKSGLVLQELKEYSGSKELAQQFPKAEKYLNWPMLITFLCKSF